MCTILWWQLCVAFLFFLLTHVTIEMFGSSDACIMYYFYLFIHSFLFGMEWNKVNYYRGIYLTYCTSPRWCCMMSVEQSVEFLAGKTKVHGGNYPSSTLSTTNPTWPVQGSNVCHSVGKPATNCLSYCTAYYFYLTQHGRKLYELVTVVWKVLGFSNTRTSLGRN
jgi:hypothetical protein